MPKFVASEIRFTFGALPGVCLVYADGSKWVRLGGMSFDYSAAGPGIRAAIARASSLAVFT